MGAEGYDRDGTWSLWVGPEKDESETGNGVRALLNNDLSMNPARNETTKEQGRRLLVAGCPYVKLHMTGTTHKIVPDPIPLGRLWDIAHGLGLEYEFPLELTSNELTEALVAAIENYYKESEE